LARIRHIALLTNDQPRLAEFYMKTFEMKEVHRHPVFGPDAGAGEAIYLSDGEINLAILPARGRPEGLFHFGFQVDSVENAAAVAQSLGATKGPEGVPKDGRFAEVFIVDPVGSRVDLSEKGWKV
jgi:catechol 2,3-dioxygenase-like lactoylglutathione lyase family enzyme